MSCPKRCFISDLYSGSIIANSRASLVRILATVLSIEPISSQSHCVAFPGRKSQHVEFIMLQLDDGTASIGFWTPRSMVKKLSVHPGDVVECVAKLCQNGEIKRFYTEALSSIEDPEMEHLRWAELTNTSSKSSRRFGYPTLEWNAEEVYRMICLQSRGGNGVMMEDLALVMRKTKKDMQAIISRLQLDGLIYHNEDEKYVPL
ncbi:unnamed protein product [Cylindrotheca closterium]|uniref:Replication protein A C-terminal domain-containing protein n=1 Tax=Cylindrotheca closterium TaxID=2856 RepID=A0AAD2FNE7_9STRA|nr:unnamed protein product [Cylindrotheca closterium]